MRKEYEAKLYLIQIQVPDKDNNKIKNPTKSHIIATTLIINNLR